jgi:hypothetical protein
MISVSFLDKRVTIYSRIDNIVTDIVILKGLDVEYLWSFDSRGNVYFVDKCHMVDYGLATVYCCYVPLFGQYSTKKMYKHIPETYDVPFVYKKINIFNRIADKTIRFTTKMLHKYFENINIFDGTALKAVTNLNKIYFGYLYQPPVYSYDVETGKFMLSEYKNLHDVIKLKIRKSYKVYLDTFITNERRKSNQILSKSKVKYDIIVKFL